MHRLVRRIAFGILLFTVWLAPSAHAQEKGSIAGKVTDKKTGHALPFATVTVIGAQRGALTNSEGIYLVAGVPAGTWEVRVQFLGYGPESRPGVVVTAGKATAIDFQLQEVVVREEKTVVITGERQLVEVKQGATLRSVTAKEIRNLPVTTVGDVLQQQAGISTDAGEIHVRGGRADETMFVVNGVANRDLVTGQSTAGQINARSVSEVNVATGAYDVKYGNALSGVVEIKLKEGTDKIQAGLTTSGGSYGGRGWQLVTSGPDPVWAPMLQKLGLKPAGTVTTILDVSGSTYNTRFDSYIQGGIPRLRSSYEDSFLGRPFHYSDAWGPSEDNRWAGRYGLTWIPNSRDKLTYTYSKRIAIDQGFSRTFLTAQGDLGDPAFPWVWAHRIGHASTFFEDNIQSSLLWRRTLSRTGFTEAQVSHYFYALRQDVDGLMWADANGKLLYSAPDDQSFFPKGDPRRDDAFYDTGDDYQWSDRRSSIWGLTWSITQAIPHNELEAGFEHQFQTVQYADIEYPWIADPSGLGQSHDLWSVHPWIGDGYLRDRLEFEGFVANIGARLDYWMVGREAEDALADTTRHTIGASERTGFYDNTYSFFGRRTKLHLSPRISVAHPITENSSFFFNYGEFTQIPSYRYVYSKLNSISSESFPLQGNPNLNPQISVNHEVGAKHQFLPTAAANLTFFVRDVYDYPSATLVNPISGTTLQAYFIYLNGHFSRSKGVEVEVEKRPSSTHSTAWGDHWSGKLTYSYQQTKGKSGDPNQDKTLQEIGGTALTPLSEVFVRWNRPHKLTANFDLRFEDDAPEGFRWLRRSGLNVFIQGVSGRAYTPYDINDQNQIGLDYSRNAPFQITTDIKVDRWFRMLGTRFDISLQGTNIFNNYLIYRVDPVTGRGYIWGAGAFDPNNVHGVNQTVKVSTVDDPSNYGPGAQWRLQLDVDL
jgi:hypothetical protein